VNPSTGAEHPDLEEALDLAVKLARHVGRQIQLPRLTRARPDYKGARDLVTEADRLSERAIVAAIRERWPAHAIFAEEETRDAPRESPYTWYVDPLDGTTNFVHGLPHFCSSIALYEGETPLAGVCYAPYTDECFFAARGRGAFLNSETIRLATTKEDALIRALLVTGFAYDGERWPNLPAFARLLPLAQGVRRLGSAALDLCYTAAGRFDGFWEKGLNSFDVAAGALMVLEAGGRVTDYEGTGGWLHGRGLVASGGPLHDTLLLELATAEGRPPPASLVSGPT
jgi:myo-inositol-1(or 4)-monophosphatase